MNRRRLLLTAIALCVTAAPLFIYAQGLVPCENDCQFCHVATLLQRIMNWLIGVLTVLFAIIFISAGLKLVTSQGNTSAKESAKKMINNAIIGFVIVLAAWLLVDMGMKMLVGNNNNFGTWNTIQCVKQPEAQIVVRSAADAIAAYGTSTAADLAAVSAFSAGDCSPENLQNYGFTATQAQVMSCLAGPESGCNNNAFSNESSAAGVFQIVYGNWGDACHSLRLPECTAANGGVPLDCRTKDDYPGSPCNKAASNFACNAAAAKCLLNAEASGVKAGYQHWTADHRSSKQVACIQKYAG